MATRGKSESEVLEFVRANPGQGVCTRIFLDLDGRHWPCGRPSSLHGTHAAFLADGRLACVEGQHPIWKPTGGAESTAIPLATDVAGLGPVAIELISAARSQTTAANNHRDELLARLDIQRQRMAELDRQLAATAPKIAAVETEAVEARRRVVGLKANLGDALADLHILQAESRAVGKTGLGVVDLRELAAIIEKLKRARDR